MDAPYVNIHTHARTGEGIELVSVLAGTGKQERARSLPEHPFSLGLHPWQAAQVSLEQALSEIEQSNADAIGEIGLDFARQENRTLQENVFRAQLMSAEQLEKPVILHCVRSFEQTLEVLKAYRLSAVIFHGFIGSREQATRAVEAGYYLSFGERTLGSPKTVLALQRVPLNRMLLETDESSLPLSELYLRTATIRNSSVSELKEHLYRTYVTLFEL